MTPNTETRELKLPPNDPVGQRAYDAIANAAEGEIVSFSYDFPKPGTKASAPKETRSPYRQAGVWRQFFKGVGKQFLFKGVGKQFRKHGGNEGF